MASAPKSNAACVAVFEAQDAVETKRPCHTVHLQDSHYKGSAKLGHGQGYLYAHDYENHYVDQQYLPDGLVGTNFTGLRKTVMRRKSGNTKLSEKK